MFRCNGTDNACCTWQNPCDLGDGDCDAHFQCKGLLRCGKNNCGGPPFDPEDDCCELPPGTSSLSLFHTMCVCNMWLTFMKI